MASHVALASWFAVSFAVFVWTSCSAGTLERVLVDETGNSRGSTKNQKAAFLRSESGQGVLEIRCVPEDGLSARLVYRLSAKQSRSEMRIRYRADESSTSDDKVWPSGKAGVILPNARQILDDSLKAATLHIKLETADDPAGLMVFRLQVVPKELSQMRNDCPEDAQPPDSNGRAK